MFSSAKEYKNYTTGIELLKENALRLCVDTWAVM
jgi:hypothetical protein